ncbi:MAG TPA: hypothetical protein VGI40_15935 [Pirellulaceae bacterium]|jgi:hypothetical protein
MKMPFAALLLLSVVPSFAFAQQPLISRIDRQPITGAPTAGVSATSTSQPMTSEMWMYLHEEQRHDDPAQAVRRKAEYKADQRLSRINSAKWYGFSNSRPEASSIPFMGEYSPGWIGNGYSRYQWIGGSTRYIPYAIVR